MKIKEYQISLVFKDGEKFLTFYHRMKSGILFLPMKSSLPDGGSVVLKFRIPGIDGEYVLKGRVVESYGQGQQQTVLKVDCKEDIQLILPGIEKDLGAIPEYRRWLEEGRIEAPSSQTASEETGHSGPEGTGLSKEWIRETVNEAEIIFEEPVIAAPGKNIGEKTDLTEEERDRIKPVGNFLMNLTKAMLRSGYYDPDHPGAIQAKGGLYQEFQRVLGDADEMMFINRETREKNDVLISGILDAPVGVKILVTEGVAGLFLPKLREYFNRKGLVSFAIKKSIGSEHFEAFIHIMSDPHMDQQEDKSAGACLTNSLVALGIVEISTVFFNDLVSLEQDLPWRVEMAIQRLAKDLRVMPMFQGSSTAAFRNMKQQIILDIIRPLKHPQLLNDFVVNCYLIAEHVEDIDAEDIETIIVNSFPYDLLLPTVKYTFEEMDRLFEARKKEPGNHLVAKRIMGIKRILKLVARRVTTEAISGAYRFLDQLYQREILSFKELPIDVQYLVKTRMLAEDVRAHFQGYIDLVINAENIVDAVTYLKCFRRAAPLFVENGEWPLMQKIIREVDRVSKEKRIRTGALVSGLKTARGPVIGGDINEMEFQDDEEILARPLIFILRDIIDKLVPIYIRCLKDPAQNREITPVLEELIDKTGGMGIDILSRVLSVHAEGAIRKAVLSEMLKKGDSARKWAMSNLLDKARPWQMHHSAITILARLGKGETDFDYVRPFAGHPHPIIREAVVDAVVELRPHDVENQLIAALNDKEPKVRWQAVRSLDKLSPLSETAMNNILWIITADPPEDPAALDAHVNHLVRLISAVNAMWYIPLTSRIEADIITTAEKYVKTRSGWKQLLMKDLTRKKSEASPVIRAAIPLLGRIGGRASVVFLKKLIRLDSAYAEAAEDAISKITIRNEN